MITLPKKQESGIKRISVHCIRVVDNVRSGYDDADIIEIARSIEQNGLQQPIKVYEIEDGYYGIVFGHRRFMAHKYLLEKEQKDFYTNIECIVCSKPEFQAMKITQLVENWQRKNCTAKENEAAVMQLKETGLSNKDIAIKTGKSEQWVSACLTAGEARLDLEASGVDTEPLSTPAMAAIGRIEEESRPEAVKETIAAGGSARAAETVARVKRGGFADEYVSTLDRVKTFINEKKAEGKTVMYEVVTDDEIIVKVIQ